VSRKLRRDLRRFDWELREEEGRADVVDKDSEGRGEEESLSIPAS
jgi:hypothetical protein